MQDGVCSPIEPTQFEAWKAAAGVIVHPSEYGILCAIDDAFVAEMNKELADYRIRQSEDAERKGRFNKGRR